MFSIIQCIYIQIMYIDNMNKNRIRLSEAQLRNIIRNTILEGVYTGTNILPQGYDDEVEQGMDRAQWDDHPKWDPYDKAYQTLVQMNNSDHYKDLDTECDWDDFDSIHEFDDENKERELDDLENKNIYESRNRKNRIKITESDLYKAINESVKNGLSEICYGGNIPSKHDTRDFTGGFGDNWTDEQWAEYKRRRAEKYKDMPDRDYFNESKGFANKEQSKMMDWKKKRTDVFYDKDGNPISKKYTPRDKDGIPKPIKVTESQLHNIVKESINKVLKEGWFGNTNGQKWYNPMSWTWDAIEHKPKENQTTKEFDFDVDEYDRRMRQERDRRSREMHQREAEIDKRLPNNDPVSHNGMDWYEQGRMLR